MQEEDGTVNEQHVVQVFDSATAPVVVRRNDMVRSALTQIAERPVDDLLLGVTALHFPGLQDTELTTMLGLRVQFVGEDGVDMGGEKAKGLVGKLVEKSKDFTDGAIDSMGEFVDGVKIFGCPSRPPLADEIRRSELP
eukprot:s1649_g6.t3